MNKLYFAILLLFTAFCKGQNLQVWGSNFMPITSYNGNTISNGVTLMIDGNGYLNLPTWRVSARITGPITNLWGQQFPADKISLLPSYTSGQFYSMSVPTIPQIGMPLQTFFQQSQEVFLIPQSQAPLFNQSTRNRYYQLNIGFDVKIEGGAYLGNFSTWTSFYAPLEIKFYDHNNNLIAVDFDYFNLFIFPLSGTPPDPTPQFSISIGSNATNGLIELSTQADYVQGKTVTYPNGLTVNANAAYQLKVKSLQGAFSTNTGNTLPLNTIKLALSQASSGNGNVFPIWLSTNNQTIANGNSTQGSPVYYDINYSSNPNDVNLISANPGNYSTTLQYEITPQ